MKEAKILFIGDISKVPLYFLKDLAVLLLRKMAVETRDTEFKVEEGFAHVPTLKDIDKGIARARQHQFHNLPGKKIRKGSQVLGRAVTGEMRGDKKRRR